MIKTNIKMRVNPKQSEAVQKICFANGAFWISTGNKYFDTDIICIQNNLIMVTNLYSLTEVDPDLFIRTNGTCEEADEKPEQYKIGMDTFEYMRANATFDEAMGFIKYNIHKYIFRKKGQEAEDMKKIKAYCDEGMWWLENRRDNDKND